MKALVHLLVCLLLTVAVFAQDSGKIFAVRHAEKQSDDPDTPLSSTGESRAECLAQTLKDAHTSTVLVTQYKRTHQTAAPLVREARATEKSFDAKANDEILKAARRAAASGNVLIVGHSNTIPQLLAALGTPPVTIPDTSYDLLFLFDLSDPKRLTTLHYCPNLPHDTTAHPANSMAKP
jgi:phosphohistidine phosphatase SixA